MSDSNPAGGGPNKQQLGVIMIGVVMVVVMTATSMALMLIREGNAQTVATSVIPADGPGANATTPPQSVSAGMGWSTGAAPEDAKVVIYEFADFLCPACASFEAVIGSQIKEELLPLEGVRLEFRTHQIINGSINAAVAAECAGAQGYFWQMHNLLFINQQIFRMAENNQPPVYADLAAYVEGLDVAEFSACQSDPNITADLVAFSEDHRRVGINATPTIVIVIGSDGGLLSGSQPITGNPSNPNVLVVIEDGEIVSGHRPQSFEEYYSIITEAVLRGVNR